MPSNTFSIGNTMAIKKRTSSELMDDIYNVVFWMTGSQEGPVILFSERIGKLIARLRKMKYSKNSVCHISNVLFSRRSLSSLSAYIGVHQYPDDLLCT